jgi:hypothetical protein
VSRWGVGVEELKEEKRRGGQGVYGCCPCRGDPQHYELSWLVSLPVVCGVRLRRIRYLWIN